MSTNTIQPKKIKIAYSKPLQIMKIEMLPKLNILKGDAYTITEVLVAARVDSAIIRQQYISVIRAERNGLDAELEETKRILLERTKEFWAFFKEANELFFWLNGTNYFHPLEIKYKFPS